VYQVGINKGTICACFTVTNFHKFFSPFWLPKGKMLSGFAIGHPGQRQVPLLVGYKGNRYLRNLGTLLPQYVASHPREWQCFCLLIVTRPTGCFHWM